MHLSTRSLRNAAFLTLVVAVAALTYSRQDRSSEKLPEPTTGYLNALENFTMGDEHFADGIAGDLEGWAVYKLDGHRSLIGKAGIRDGYDGEGRLRVKVDGVTVKELKLSPGKKPVPLSIDVKGKQSLRIELHYCSIGTPRLTKAPPPPNPITPSDKIAKPGVLRFEWQPYEGATAYGLQIVSTGLEGSALPGAPRLWCYTIEETECDIDTSAYPPGVYRWAVVAFDRQATLTPFTESKTFTIRK